MPSKIADAWIVGRKSETTHRREVVEVLSDQSFDLLGQEYDENQAFGFDVRWPLHHRYYCRLKTSQPKISFSKVRNTCTLLRCYLLV
jgi:hypothetical protein